MGIFLPPAYAIGLLSQLQRQEVELRQQLAGAQARAVALQRPLHEVVVRLAEADAAEQQRREQAFRSATQLADHNAKVAALNREIAALRRRAEQLTEVIAATLDEAAQLEIRQRRATWLVQATQRAKRLEAVTAQASAAREAVQQARRDAVPFADRQGALQLELQRLHAELPRPAAIMRLSEVEVAAAHCHLLLDGDADAWAARLAAASAPVVQLHADLQAGRYPLEASSEVTGGRAHATVVVLFGLLARQQWEAARQFFRSATVPQWFFHQIFNVFLVWSFGLYITEQRDELQRLLSLHEHAEGLRGAYARALLGLLRKDAALFDQALRRQIQADWESWRRLPQKGLGVVNLGAVALCRLADGIALPRPPTDLGPTVPRTLLQ